MSTAHQTDVSNVHIDRKQYWIIWVVLLVATVIEVAVAYVIDDVTALITVLTLLAVGKACIVGWFYMHLSHETWSMRMTVFLPMCIPFFYAAVLIAEVLSRSGFFL